MKRTIWLLAGLGIGLAAHAAPQLDPALRASLAADDLDPAGNALAAERLGAALVRAQEEIGDAVDLDAVVLLRHGQVAASQPGLDVRHRDALDDGGPRPGERRVRVAEDEDAVRSGRVDPLLEPRAHLLDIGRSEVEVDRFGQPELVAGVDTVTRLSVICAVWIAVSAAGT